MDKRWAVKFIQSYSITLIEDFNFMKEQTPTSRKQKNAISILNIALSLQAYFLKPVISYRESVVNCLLSSWYFILVEC